MFLDGSPPTTEFERGVQEGHDICVALLRAWGEASNVLARRSIDLVAVENLERNAVLMTKLADQLAATNVVAVARSQPGDNGNPNGLSFGEPHEDRSDPGSTDGQEDRDGQ